MLWNSLGLEAKVSSLNDIIECCGDGKLLLIIILDDVDDVVVVVLMVA